MSIEVFLSADIGGTNTRLRLYEVDTSGKFATLALDKVESLPGKLIHEQKYHNEGHHTLLEVIHLFLQEAKPTVLPSTACLAVAGPVSNNRAYLTNRSSWNIDGKTIGKVLGLQRIRVINDFVAMGYGLLTLNEETECVELQKAPKHPDAPIACIGAGTGLGECFITPNGLGGHECYGSEGGHAEFAPRSPLEIRLLQYLSHKFETKHRISVERLVSGNGLANIYEFLSLSERPQDVTPAVHAQVMAAPESDRGRIVSINADNCPLCMQTMLIFTATYGAEAGVAALKWLPQGGLYLTGGLTSKCMDYITGHKAGTENLFLGALLDKGRVSGMLSSIPIYAVKVEDLGERGAQYTALKLLQEVARERERASGVAAAAAKVLHACTGSPTAALTRDCETTCSSLCKNKPCCWWVTAAVVAALAVGAFTVCKHHCK